MQTLLQNNQHPETIRSISMALIIFGTLASALAVSAVRRDSAGIFSRVYDFFFGDKIRKGTSPSVAKTEPANAAAPEPQPTMVATSRREMDNFDLSIFEDF